MKLIIDIPEEEYISIRKQVLENITNPLKVCIANGIPYEPQGKWVAKHLWDNTHVWVCSKCGNRNTHGITVEKACWKCGVEMKGGAE